MTELFEPILAQSAEHLNIILLMGLAIFFGTAGARIFQKFHIPQVVGYVIIGLVIGESGLTIIGPDTVEALSLFNIFALGIIGFMIGGELKADIFNKYGKQFFIILFAEGIATFVLVAGLCGFVIFQISGNLNTSIAMALVLGAIASATAPAATVHVLWEYKTRGPLTSTVLAIVALDDCLALTLYGIASAVAAALLGQTNGSIWTTMGTAVYEIAGAVFLGVLAGFILSVIIKHIKEPDKALAFTISAVLLVIGISVALKLGAILAAMVFGVTIANLAPRRRKRTFELVEKFSPPIYVLFFVLAGAHLVLSEIAGWMIIVIIVYLLARTAGKFFGSWIGAKTAKAVKAVRNYLGFCLLSQAGVAIGLAIISSQLFEGEFGHSIIVIIMTTTFVVEIIGPMFVKLGVNKAGEVGLNITVEDLIETYKVGDVMSTDVPKISAGMSLKEIIRIVGDTNSFYYPVIDNDNKLRGAITLDGIRNTLNTTEANEWLIALDIMEPIIAKTTSGDSLDSVLEKIKHLNLEHMPVVRSDNNEFVGVVNERMVSRSLNAEVLDRQQKADMMHSQG
jgi:Kef-type K+ transport system membrane component KefB